MAQIPNAPAVAAPAAVDPSSGGSSVSTAAPSGGADSSSTISVSNLADLKAKAPTVYNAMMVGIAQNMCQDMEQQQARLKKIMDDGRNNNS